jgi:hypothetical protein
MLVINIKENESIDKALKRFKKLKTGVLKEHVTTAKAICNTQNRNQEGCIHSESEELKTSNLVFYRHFATIPFRSFLKGIIFYIGTTAVCSE